MTDMKFEKKEMNKSSDFVIIRFTGFMVDKRVKTNMFLRALKKNWLPCARQQKTTANYFKMKAAFKEISLAG